MQPYRFLSNPFVDTVKLAVPGFIRRHGTAEGSHPRVQAFQQPKNAAVRRVTNLCRCLFAIAGAAVAIAAWAADYPLLAMPAPDFALHGFAGDNVRLSEHRGEVVVLTFWSTRCSTCAAQLHALDRSFVTYRSAGLQMFGISVDDDQGRARDFAASQRVAFKMLADPDKAVSRLYEVDNLPMAVLIDRSGTVRDVHRDFGSQSEALYLRELRGLLNE